MSQSWTEAAALLRRWRTRSGLTQPALAERLGVSVSTIARISRATDDDHPNTRPDVLFGLAKLMDRSGAAFLTHLGYEDLAADLRDELGPQHIQVGTVSERETAHNVDVTDDTGLSDQVRHSLSYGGAELSPEEEARVLAYIEGMRSR